jgi:iron complex outermembrane receptor protein
MTHERINMAKIRNGLFTTLLLIHAHGVTAESSEGLGSDIAHLMALEVESTSSMKRSQPVNTTPASIFVLERADIESSGYTTIPELLKLIPGIDARRIDNNQWAVSVRSAASRFNTNIMVMLDGRNVGEANINGMYWEALDYPIDDIERIELVRGAAGSLWGNSANNGILNIITKHSLDTQGVKIAASVGSNVTGTQNLRVGGAIDDQVSYRFFASHRKANKSHPKIDNGQYIPLQDHASRYSIGGQFDYQYTEKSAIKAQYQSISIDNGVVNRGINPQTFGSVYTKDYSKIDNDALNFRIDHNVDESLKLFSQLSFTDVSIRSLVSSNVYQSFSLNSAVNYQWTGGFLSAGLDVEKNNESIAYLDNVVVLQSKTYGLFLQNEHNIIDDKLNILLGIRWDYLAVYDVGASPNIRINYQHNKSNSLWGSLSIGNRIMASSDEEKQVSFVQPNDQVPIPTFITLNTKDAVEKATITELGYRYQGDKLNVNASFFYYDYRALINGEPEPTFYTQWPITQDITIPALVYSVNNKAQGSSSGGDLVALWQPSNDVTMTLGYSYIDYELADQVGKIAFSPDDFHNTQIYTQVRYAVNKQLTAQLLVKYVGSNSSFLSPSYYTVDFAINWHINSQLKFALSGQNLVNSHFVEYEKENELFTASSALGRNVSLFFSYQF